MLALKPMNCPGHVQIFRQGMRSYRDLPLRWRSSAPATATSRPAPCTASCACAASPRTTRISSARRSRSPPRRCDSCALLCSVYRDLGFEEFRGQVRDRPEPRRVSDAVWDQAEKR